MAGYPVLLNLKNRRCLVVGGGVVAARKVEGLLAEGARVTIISPTLHLTLSNRLEAGEIDYYEQAYASGILALLRPVIVFAATDSPEVNLAVAQEASSLAIMVNVADDSCASDFSSMASVQRAPITIALATGGASPALTAHLKQRLDDLLGEEYTLLARWLGELRPLVKAQIASQSDRQNFWKAVIESDVLAYLRQGDIENAQNVIQSLLKTSART